MLLILLACNCSCSGTITTTSSSISMSMSRTSIIKIYEADSLCKVQLLFKNKLVVSS